MEFICRMCGGSKFVHNYDTMYCDTCGIVFKNSFMFSLPYNYNVIKVKKMNENAIIPSKNRTSDSGYDISIISYKSKGNGIYFCDTGIAIEPPKGYYFDLIGRSSLPKNNFHFLGGVGVIDMEYRGSIKLMFQQIDKSLPLPELPFKCAQIIPRKIDHFDIIEVNELEETERGQKGFGSTGK